jgi:chromosome segregation ATPase
VSKTAFVFLLSLICVFVFCLAATGISTCRNPGGNQAGGAVDTSGVERARGLADGIGERIGGTEKRLLEAEASLGEASLSLEKSETELIPLREGLRKLREELAALTRQAARLNARLTRLEREKKFWKVLAISAGLAFLAIETGRAIGK